jgi:hemolysin III
MDISRFHPEVAGTPEEPRPTHRWPQWWWSRVEISSNTHRSFGHQAPLTRGWLHRASVLVWPFFIAQIVGVAESTQARIGALTFGLSMQAMFTASATTHLRRWNVWTTELLFRLDHTGIFLAIAGSITPFALLVLTGWASTTVLVLAWAAATVGIVAALWPKPTPVGFGNTAFICFGAIVVPFVPLALERVDAAGLVLLAAGGAVYIAGAIMLAYQWPKLSPRVFGYHEVWHTMVVIGVTLHYVMIERYFLPLA